MSEPYWSPTRVEQLTQLRCVEGKTCDAIGAIMGITKNTVIGKLGRLGLQPNEGAPQTVMQRVMQRVRQSARPVGGICPTTSERLTALDKFPGASRCVYPHGHVGEEGFGFCGERTGGSENTYCPAHHALCWKPVDTAAMKQLNFAAGRIGTVAAVPKLQN